MVSKQMKYVIKGLWYTRNQTIKKRVEEEPHPPTLESVTEAIDGLDLEKFREKYTEIDVDDQFDRFRDHWLYKNDSRTGKPNYLKWTDWNRAFHSWCRQALKFAEEDEERKRKAEPEVMKLPEW